MPPPNGQDIFDDRPNREISTELANWFTYVSAAIAVAAVLYAIFLLIARRSPLLMFCILGSVLCNPIEPIWEALGFLRFHPRK